MVTCKKEMLVKIRTDQEEKQSVNTMVS